MVDHAGKPGRQVPRIERRCRRQGHAQAGGRNRAGQEGAREENAVKIICVLAAAGLCLAAVRGDEAMYVGGTITSVQEKTEGRFGLENEQAARFVSKKGQFSILYTSITSLEYGQKAGRRVGVALVV